MLKCAQSESKAKFGLMLRPEACGVMLNAGAVGWRCEEWVGDVVMEGEYGKQRLKRAALPWMLEEYFIGLLLVDDEGGKVAGGPPVLEIGEVGTDISMSWETGLSG